MFKLTTNIILRFNASAVVSHRAIVLRFLTSPVILTRRSRNSSFLSTNSQLVDSFVDMQRFLGRPTYLSADLGFTANDLLSSIFVSYPRSRWTELNQNQPHARKWLCFENVCPKSGVYASSANRGPQNHFFNDFAT